MKQYWLGWQQVVDGFDCLAKGCVVRKVSGFFKAPPTSPLGQGGKC